MCSGARKPMQIPRYARNDSFENCVSPARRSRNGDSSRSLGMTVLMGVSMACGIGEGAGVEVGRDGIGKMAGAVDGRDVESGAAVVGFSGEMEYERFRNFDV